MSWRRQSSMNAPIRSAASGASACAMLSPNRSSAQRGGSAGRPVSQVKRLRHVGDGRPGDHIVVEIAMIRGEAAEQAVIVAALGAEVERAVRVGVVEEAEHAVAGAPRVT